MSTGTTAYYFHHLHRQRQQATVTGNQQQQPGSPSADLCTVAGRQQADSIIVYFFSADSPTGMFRQHPTDSAAQQALPSSVDKELPTEAQLACEGEDEGVTLAELRSALKASARGKSQARTACSILYSFLRPAWPRTAGSASGLLPDPAQPQPTGLHDPGGLSPCCTSARAPDPLWTATAPSPSSTAITTCWPRRWQPDLGLLLSM